jgi:hypothetical protein
VVGIGIGVNSNPAEMRELPVIGDPDAGRVRRASKVSVTREGLSF